MDIVRLLIADDEKFVHQDIRDSLDSIHFGYQIVKDFYDTLSLMKFLQNFQKESEEEDIDLLILDHNFGGTSMSGLDVLPYIRKIYPALPIIIMSTFDDDTFENARRQYHIDYLQKPVKASDLRWRIRSLIDAMADWTQLRKDFDDNKELTEFLLDQNDALENDLHEAHQQNILKTLPMNMIHLVQNIFPDIEFTVNSFRLLIKKNITDKEWKRIFRSLKVIDWKHKDIPAGVKVQKFKEADQMGHPNTWEYRFSRGGRIFAEYRKDKQPLILLLDPGHEYTKIHSF